MTGATGGSRDDWLADFTQRVEQLLAEHADWFELGLSQSADEFFRERAPWLASTDSVRVVPNSDGNGHEIVIRVDGAYSDEGEARDIASLLQAKLYGHLARLHADPDSR